MSILEPFKQLVRGAMQLVLSATFSVIGSTALAGPKDGPWHYAVGLMLVIAGATCLAGALSKKVRHWLVPDLR